MGEGRGEGEPPSLSMGEGRVRETFAWFAAPLVEA